LWAPIACRQVVFFLQHNWWSLLGVPLRLRRLCSGCRNLHYFGNVECDLIGVIYCDGICTLNFHAPKWSHATPSSGAGSVRSFARMT